MSRDYLDRKKQWLNRYKQNRVKISRLRERLNTLDNRITGIKSPQITGMPRGGTRVDMADLIADKNEIEIRLQRLEDKGVIYRSEILEAIDCLADDRLSEILEYWFIKDMSADDIADVLGYNVRHVWRLYSQAISRIEIDQVKPDQTRDSDLSSE